jgi:hypothetical protein
VRLEAIADVHLESPPHRRERIRRFYSRLIGLAERPREADVPEDLCFASELLRLRVRVTADALPSPNRRRALIRVPSLPMLMEALSEQGFTYQIQRGLSFFDRRLLVLDPAGNLVELKEELPL